MIELEVMESGPIELEVVTVSADPGYIPVLIDKTITANGVYQASSDSADGYREVTASVPNTYTAADEGKVVDGGALVSQTVRTITSNGTYDTTKNNSVTASVPNTYTAGDEGKVVDGGALVSQTSATYTTNDTYDTTLINEVVVNVSGGGGVDDPVDFTGGNILAIKGHGTEYIITDIYPNFVGVYGTKFSDDNITNYEYYWCALGLSTGYLGLQRNGTSQNILVKGMGGNAPAVSYPGFSGGNIITQVFSSIGLSEPLNKQQPLAFGRGYYNGSMEAQIATYTFYGLNILNSDFEYTYRFVPWFDNGVACIKELISGTIYYNSGTGGYDYIDLDGVLHTV